MKESLGNLYVLKGTYNGEFLLKNQVLFSGSLFVAELYCVFFIILPGSQKGKNAL